MEDSRGIIVISEEVNSIDCDSLCQITLNNITILDFNITVFAVNAVGQSSNITSEISIGKFAVISVCMCKANHIPNNL